MNESDTTSAAEPIEDTPDAAGIRAALGEEEKQGLLGKLGLFAFTIILFFSLGLGSWSTDDLIILVAVILFHELGHFVAMKLFRYNDVKMFFIPFIGAAVSGKPVHHSSAKSAIISLMGPLPGLIAGGFFVYLFLLEGDSLYRKIAYFLLFLNGFNLLPLTPLDGGRFFEEILFSKNRFFEMAFAILAVLVFAGLGILLRDWLLGLLALINIIQLAPTFHISTIATQLKKKQINNLQLHKLSAEHLNLITEKLREKFPKLFDPLSGKALAGYASRLIERVNAGGTSVLKTIVFIISYAVIALGAIVCAGLLVVNNHEYELHVYKDKKVLKSFYAGDPRPASEVELNQKNEFHGTATAYYQDGKIMQKIEFKNGKVEGKWIEYDQKGAILFSDAFKKGRHLLRYANGKTYKLSELNKGVQIEIKERLQKTYVEDLKTKRPRIIDGEKLGPRPLQTEQSSSGR